MVKKKVQPAKWCKCGEFTTSYVIINNQPICKDCQKEKND